MLLSCSICLNFFDPSSDIFCLPCGHMYHVACTMQWFERTQSCPQCRKPTTEKKCIKVFPHVAEQGTQQDPSQLMQTIDSLNLEIRKLTKNIHDGENSLTEMTKEMIQLKDSQEVMSSELVRLNSHNALLKKQVKMLKNIEAELKVVKIAKEKAENDLKLVKNFSKVMDGNLNEADEALKASANSSDVNSILTMCCSLKRELETSRKRIIHLKNSLEGEKSHFKRKIAEMEEKHKKEIDALNIQMNQLEKELMQLELSTKKKQTNVNSQLEDLGVDLLSDPEYNSQKSSTSTASGRSQASGSSMSSVPSSSTFAKSRVLKQSNTNKVKMPLQKPGSIFRTSHVSASGSSSLMKRLYDNAANLPDGMTYDGMGRTVRAESAFKSKTGVLKKPKV